MKPVLPILFLILLLTACNASPTPIVEVSLSPDPDTPSPPQINAPLVESPSLTSIYFINSLDGWGVTETQIVRTTDGGITWYDVTPPNIAQTGYGIDTFALDARHFWAQVPNLGDFHSGTLHRTDDGGLTWESVSTPFSGADLQFLDANNGWALAQLGVAAGSNAVSVFQTDDGGATWIQKFTNDPNRSDSGDSLPFGGLKGGITPSNMEKAWVYGVTYSFGTPYLFHTVDGGVTWGLSSLPLPSGAENYELGIDPGNMKFVSPLDGFIAMRLAGDVYQTAVYVTNNGAETWTLTPTLIPNGGSADFISPQEMVLYNGEQFYVTTDAARTWSIIPPDVKFNDIFAGMDFVDLNTGWVVTLDPTGHRSLYKTTNGGSTWSPVIP